MATVSEIALKYSAKGAKAAQRADRGVRDSVQQTAKDARGESGTINRWMERHKSSIKKIGIATTAAMGAILSASPTMRAELNAVRTAFSLFADTVVNDVLPAGQGLADWAFRAEEAYSNLPDPVREAASHLLIFAGLLVLAAGAIKLLVGAGLALWGGLKSLGGVIATVVGAAKALGPILAGIWAALVVGAKVVAAVIGAIIGLISAKAILIATAIAAIVAVVAFVVAVLTNYRGMRDRVIEIFTEVGEFWIEFFSNFVERAGVWGASFASRIADGIGSRISSIRERAAEIRDDVTDRVTEAVDNALGWGEDMIDRISEGVADRRDALLEQLRNLGEMAADAFRNAFNAVMPSSVSIPSTTIGGRTVGGGSISLPRLRHGGLIESGGLARVHAGERVIPAADVSQDAGGGGGSTVVNIEQHIESGGSPRRTADKSAQAVSQAIQDEYGARR